MALKRFTPTAADRQIIQLIIAQPGGKADIDLAKKVREVRRRLRVRQFEKELDKLNLQFRDLGLTFSTWDNLMDSEELLETLAEILENEKVKDEKPRLAKLSKRAAAFLTPQEFTIDEVYLDWLLERLQARDWSKAKQQQQDGSSKEIEVDVHPSHMEAVAEFSDLLGQAISAPSITEEKESCCFRAGSLDWRSLP
jgi:hypothetical protein